MLSFVTATDQSSCSHPFIKALVRTSNLLYCTILVRLYMTYISSARVLYICSNCSPMLCAVLNGQFLPYTNLQWLRYSEDAQVFDEYCINYYSALIYLDALRKHDSFCYFEKVGVVSAF